jgi:hypothetical protein
VGGVGTALGAFEVGLELGAAVGSRLGAKLGALLGAALGFLVGAVGLPVGALVVGAVGCVGLFVGAPVVGVPVVGGVGNAVGNGVGFAVTGAFVGALLSAIATEPLLECLCALPPLTGPWAITTKLDVAMGVAPMLLAVNASVILPATTDTLGLTTSIALAVLGNVLPVSK